MRPSFRVPRTKWLDGESRACENPFLIGLMHFSSSQIKKQDWIGSWDNILVHLENGPNPVWVFTRAFGRGKTNYSCWWISSRNVNPHILLERNSRQISNREEATVAHRRTHPNATLYTSIRFHYDVSCHHKKIPLKGRNSSLPNELQWTNLSLDWSNSTWPVRGKCIMLALYRCSLWKLQYLKLHEPHNASQRPVVLEVELLVARRCAGRTNYLEVECTATYWNVIAGGSSKTSVTRLWLDIYGRCWLLSQSGFVYVRLTMKDMWRCLFCIHDLTTESKSPS